MTTIFTHPAVATYLAELDEALRERPDGHADDLRDQVRAHIEDAIAPDATAAEVEAELRRLGSPRSLVSDDTETPPAIVYTRPSVSGWLSQRPRNWWAAFWVVAILLVAGTGGVIIEANVAHVTGKCTPCGYLFVQDRQAARGDSVADVHEWKVPQRWGQDQAFTFTIYNPSRYAQQVSGGPGGKVPSASGDEPMRLDIATRSQAQQDVFTDWPRHFVAGAVTIPARSSRQVVLHWVHNDCYPRGGSETSDSMQLTAHTLGVTRTETILFGEVFTMTGSGAPDRCRTGQIAHGTFRSAQ